MAIRLTDLADSYMFVYTIYDTKKLTFCDSNNKDFIIRNITNVTKNEMYSFGNTNDVIEWLNHIFLGKLHFRAVLFGNNEHKSKNNDNPIHMQKELNKYCEEEHNFWINKGYTYDSSLIYDEIECINIIYNNLDIIPDYGLRQRLKDEISSLCKKRDNVECEVNDLDKYVKENKEKLINQKYILEKLNNNIKEQQKQLNNIIDRYRKGKIEVNKLDEKLEEYKALIDYENLKEKSNAVLKEIEILNEQKSKINEEIDKLTSEKQILSKNIESYKRYISNVKKDWSIVVNKVNEYIKQHKEELQKLKTENYLKSRFLEYIEQFKQLIKNPLLKNEVDYKWLLDICDSYGFTKEETIKMLNI